MAKNTVKTSALDMFSETKPVLKNRTAQIKAETPKQPVQTSKSSPKDSKNETEAKIETSSPVTAETNASNEVENKLSGISLKMSKAKVEKKSRGRSFYLSDNIYERLANQAKKNNVSISEFLEYILKQVL
ncbi:MULTISPECIES: hypothetical protein [unclassified Butyrivibrio]|uniref:hypothetical protein n=1 Tax=unclassified Butyrivibrio TaxID=2639466 RepID=UPI00040BB059|nr:MULTISPECIES: hypothetical protein [unclassified Butyrivibrio]